MFLGTIAVRSSYFYILANTKGRLFNIRGYQVCMTELYKYSK